VASLFILVAFSLILASVLSRTNKRTRTQAQALTRDPSRQDDERKRKRRRKHNRSAAHKSRLNQASLGGQLMQSHGTAGWLRYLHPRSLGGSIRRASPYSCRDRRSARPTGGRQGSQAVRSAHRAPSVPAAIHHPDQSSSSSPKARRRGTRRACNCGRQAGPARLASPSFFPPARVGSR
jgi:hypothetical protein